MKDKKVISFERPAEFYYQTALKNIDDGDFIAALPLIRQAIAKAPEETEYSVTLAEALTEIGKFDESNALLFELVKNEEYAADCYFGIGCNFIGINDAEKARQSFEKYLELDPEGDYRDDVLDFLSFIDEYGYDDDDFLEDAAQRVSYDLAGEGKLHLDRGDFQKAIEILSRIDAKGAEMAFARNNLALSYFCNRQTDDAIRTTEEVLTGDPANVHANCNMALFCNEKHDRESTEKYVGIITRTHTDVPDELYKIAITLCDLHRHESALSFLGKYLDMCPYDERALFFSAIANYNTGRYNAAVTDITDVLKIDPDNSLATYYCGYFKRAMDKTLNPHLEYRMAVPPSEALRRVEYLNKAFSAEPDKIYERWQNDKEFESVLLWGMEYGELSMRRAIAGIIAGFRDKKAERKLREYIIKADKPDEIKSDIFVFLKKMGAKEPYIANISGSVVEVKVGLPESLDGGADDEDNDDINTDDEI